MLLRVCRPRLQRRCPLSKTDNLYVEEAALRINFANDARWFGDNFSLSDLRLRCKLSSDGALIEQIYAASRDAEMRQLDWPAEQKQAFLRSQCALQAAHYAAHYPGAHFLIVEQGVAAVGRLYWQWQNHPGTDSYALHLIEITLLPEHRGHGLAGALIRGLQAQARQVAACMTLHVDPYIPALALYQHLGFKPLARQTEGNLLPMHWKA